MDIPVEVGVSPTLGVRGLMAARDIVVGEVIERCPVVLVPIKDEQHLDACVLGNYYYLWDANYHALALGYGSLFNHSYDANVKFTCDIESRTIIYTAVKSIRRGEELTNNYNGEPDDETPLNPGEWW